MSPVIKTIESVRDWYGRFERPISSLSLFGGFLFDALTLKRVDMFWENFWVIVHLLIVGVAILLINMIENEGDYSYNVRSPRFWYINIMQFFFGGLFSTFLVFYFRSSALSVSWPFMLLLVIAFMANERLKRHFERVAFQISLFFLSIYCFAIFLLPVLLHKIGPLVFLLSGGASILFILFFLWIIRIVGKETFKKSRKMIISSVLSILAVMNVLYFANIIPPIPLSLKDGGVYHEIRKDNGRYVVTGENQGFFSFLKLYDTFHASPSDPVYVLSAIFSPTDLNTSIVHEWQRYDEASSTWVTSSRITVKIMGGREEGWRTFTEKSGLTKGKWRVNVETPRGQVIGTIRFKIEEGNGELKSEEK